MKTSGTRDEQGVIEHAASSILLEHLALVLRVIWSSATLLHFPTTTGKRRPVSVVSS